MPARQSLDGEKDFVRRLGFRLSRYRVANGLSLRQLAERVGCSYVNLWQIEKGRSSPGAFLVVLLAKEMGCSVDALVSDKGD